MLKLLFALFIMSTGDPGPVVETCAFLPADNPCHFPPPPPDLCYDENFHPILCGPIE